MTTTITPPGEFILTELGINPSNLSAEVSASQLDHYIVGLKQISSPNKA